jgi:hypothetical protein
MQVPLERVKILDRTVLLQLSIVFEDDRAKLTVPVPPNYPNTQVKSLPLLFEGLIIYQRMYYSKYEVRNFLHRYGVDLSIPGLYIAELYKIPRTRAIPVVEDEQLAFKGLGKKVLCRCIPIIVEVWGLKPSVPISLAVASPIADYQRYSALSKRKIALHILQLGDIPDNERQEELIDLISNSKGALARSLGYLVANNKLADYYRTLGMNRVEEYGYHISMATSVGIFLQHCSQHVE